LKRFAGWSGVLGLLLALTVEAWSEEVPLADIREALARGVQTIIETQRDDGVLALSGDSTDQYPIGNTALGIMALEYARPHLDGELRIRANQVIQKGIAYILQQPPEQKTYSAGLTICALFKENPDRYKNVIAAYAMMLCISQNEVGYESGEWGYRLRPVPKPQERQTGSPDNWGDKSNTQFALLGLYFAQRSGFQVPKIIWARAADHYRRAQFPDGGWGYKPELRPDPYANMTIASTISLHLCEEMLRSGEHKQCIAPPRSKEIDAGLKWIGDNWVKGRIGSDTYGLYALERLGIIMGRANIEGHDWFNEGARILLRNRNWGAMLGSNQTATAFGVMFLARGLEPIIINKLERPESEDWNNDPYDVKYLVEHIQDAYQQPVQWRIVTLEAPLELLLRTPMLYISGHKALSFTAEEKEKLKAYVAGGGTLIGQACCGKREFDKSFRELVKELFGADMQPIPATHRIYERVKLSGSGPKPRVEIAAGADGQGRPVVIYLPNDQCCLWHMGGAGARSAYALGSGIYFYVTIEIRKMYEDAHPEIASGRAREAGDAGRTTTEKPVPAEKPAEGEKVEFGDAP